MPDDLLPPPVPTSLNAGCPDTSAARFEQCAGGPNLTVSIQCRDVGTACYTKNEFFAQCLTPTDLERASRADWDGLVLECGDSLPTPPAIAPSRRLSQVC